MVRSLFNFIPVIAILVLLLGCTQGGNLLSGPGGGAMDEFGGPVGGNQAVPGHDDMGADANDGVIDSCECYKILENGEKECVECVGQDFTNPEPPPPPPPGPQFKMLADPGDDEEEGYDGQDDPDQHYEDTILENSSF